MRGVIQRVKKASVMVDGENRGEIGVGMLLFLGITHSDGEADIDYIVDKVLNCRIFSDQFDKMNLSLIDNHYEVLVISQFTLYGDARKGRRPSFTESAKPDNALIVYNLFLEKLKMTYNSDLIKSGVFQADMKVDLINDGPVTILLDSGRAF
ncbi:MAG: D-tyrosyl-tRNA(Tyr) deacylase [Spirochaetes bacterium GWF1_31_7]|nr:MAG: D-tyrosyl-tRNA(Tyr) deacylase [Spirochaetes bacterium GWE1_32_154]OHD46841.1 MAG: D-tyrosyl-tRNA(Tyr) deacylase [Spirochaetes bacterium GWE2_31_10]OHD47772.1 MAG: D-tyrosyl-tRNA(Tyr) deacylase [Spirochaetes bacterium GWF1_31_7]OHD73168.1 MAG: D-tyrosyl-tRNA(Tyr) deacylase [Spirochaetes bacterium RIFOXYB1_FULL_32_8]HBD95627.1 D-tyrosyl-tRNA(Tyr) deacylase [Spirochaetia bacterium]